MVLLLQLSFFWAKMGIWRKKYAESKKIDSNPWRLPSGLFSISLKCTFLWAGPGRNDGSAKCNKTTTFDILWTIPWNRSKILAKNFLLSSSLSSSYHIWWCWWIVRLGHFLSFWIPREKRGKNWSLSWLVMRTFFIKHTTKDFVIWYWFTVIPQLTWISITWFYITWIFFRW